MQLNITTDYAIRIILYLGMKKGVVSSKEISENMGITQNYVIKITSNLSNAGFVKKVRGMNGGFMLIKDDLTLYDIVEKIEPTIRINRCIEEEQYCSRCATKNCAIRRKFVGLQGTIDGYLKSITIKDLIDESRNSVI
ncbi:MAG: Rrf2 family transcriptional regulator [Clostridioides sp.]|nr:Rrf2 family transcriptional regulator [Clostridioides sp.]